MGSVLDGGGRNIFVGKQNNLVANFGMFGFLVKEIKNFLERKSKRLGNFWSDANNAINDD